MEARANDINILENYKVANPEERFEIMFAHYSFFPKVIRKLEKKTQFKIKAEREYLRSHNRGELGVRVQTSNISSPTEDEAIDNIEIEEAFKTGEINSSLLKGIDNAVQYEEDIRITRLMRMDYELLEEMIEDLEDEETKIMKEYLVNKRFMKEIAVEFGMSYETVKRKIRIIKEDLLEEIIECLEMNCREEV